MAEAGNYHRPNHFPLKERITNCVLAVLLIAYGSYGIYMDDIYLPGKRTAGVHLHGIPVWLMYGAILSAASVMLALVVDHYDRRNNEHHYVQFKKSAAIVGWVFFGAALLWELLGPSG